MPEGLPASGSSPTAVHHGPAGSAPDADPDAAPPSADDLLATGDAAADWTGLVAHTRHMTFDAPLLLQCGQYLPVVNLAYQTYGTLNADKSNAVLVCHALSGDAHAAGRDPVTGRMGWWNNMIGPGKGLDTDHYFVICSNCIGGCKGSTGPASINPDTGRPYAREFPVITIADMVEAQRWLIDELGIRQLLAVVGGSMGGMQVLEWAVRYPDRVRAALPIATTARLNAQAIAFNAVGRNAILSDPNYQQGQYYAPNGGSGEGPDVGLAIARMVGHITYLSEESMHAKFGRTLRERDRFGYDFRAEFSIETYLDHQGSKFVERFDANSYLYITKAMDYFDLAAWRPQGTASETPANEHAALAGVVARTRARVLVVSFSSDWLFTPAQSRTLVNALIAADRDVSYCNIQSPYGHDAFLLEPRTLGRLIRGFLHGCAHPEEHGQPQASPAIVTDAGEPGPPPAPAPAAPALRVDYDTIADLVEPAASVLDIGCGAGELISRLVRTKGVRASGLELDQESVVRAVESGLTVRQGDADVGLPQYRDGQFDYVVLSQTLQAVRRPDVVIKEILRVGRRAIVSFPNFAHWRARLQLGLGGLAPRTSTLPFEWYDSPNIRFLSLHDFERFCGQIGARVLHRIPLVGWSRERVRWWANLRAEEAVYVISAHAH